MGGGRGLVPVWGGFIKPGVCDVVLSHISVQPVGEVKEPAVLDSNKSQQYLRHVSANLV